MKRNTVMKHWPVLLLAASAVLYTSCGKKPAGAAGSNEYAVRTLEASDAQLSYTYPATIRGKQDIEIRPKIAGFITRLCVDEGAQVRKGQMLFVIDDVQYSEAVKQAAASVRSAEASVATAQLTYNNKKQLFKQNIIGDYDMQTAANTLAAAEAALAQTRAALATARQNLAYCHITSPTNGIIGSIPYRVGSLVSSSSATPLTTVSNVETMYVYFSMTEKQLLDMTRTSGGTARVIQSFPPVRLQLADGSTYDHPGRITTISGVIDQQTGSVSLRADFSNPGHLLKTGGSGNIVIPHVAQRAIMIPQSSTVEVQDKKYVYVVSSDNKVTYTEIGIADIDDGQSYLVTSGLKAGDRIVTQGVSNLKDGMQITPITEQQAAAKVQQAIKMGAMNMSAKMKAMGK